MPEKVEGPAVDPFIEDFIVKGMQTRGLSKFFLVEREHRILGAPPKPGAPPRTITARI